MHLAIRPGQLYHSFPSSTSTRLPDSMSESLKRKKSPVSSRAKTRKRNPEQGPWGELKEDFIPVKISFTLPPVTTMPSEVVYQFTNVSYTEYKTGEQITALVEHGILSLTVEENLKIELRHKLGPLIQKFKPLENLTSIQVHDESLRPKFRWCWKTDVETPHMDSLCEDFYEALLYSMGDTEGKHTVRRLLEEIVTRLNRTTLKVRSTGSTKASRCACLVEMDYVYIPSPTSSSSSEEPAQEYVNYKAASEIGESPLTLRSSVQNDSPKPTGPGSSSADKQSPPDQKRRISDVLVFSKVSPYEPVVSNLVVSIKSGQVVNPIDIVQELLGRLPYQSGIIYGLEINQLKAHLYSVEKKGEDSGPVVRLSSYPVYFFQKTFHDFDFPALEKMVLDIGFILMVNHDHHP